MFWVKITQLLVHQPSLEEKDHVSSFSQSVMGCQPDRSVAGVARRARPALADVPEPSGRGWRGRKARFRQRRRQALQPSAERVIRQR